MRRPLNDCLWRQLSVKTKPVEYNNYCPPQPKSWVVLVLVMSKRREFYVGASWVCEWQQKEKISVEYFLSLLYILYVIYSLDNIAQHSEDWVSCSLNSASGNPFSVFATFLTNFRIFTIFALRLSFDPCSTRWRFMVLSKFINGTQWADITSHTHSGSKEGYVW